MPLYDPTTDPRTTTLCACGCGRYIREPGDPPPQRWNPSDRALAAVARTRKGHKTRSTGSRAKPRGHQRTAHGYTLTHDSDFDGSLVNARYAREARRIAAAVLGRPVPGDVYVWHVNGEKGDNRHENLVIGSRGYVRLLTIRRTALRACGHADWRQCILCHAYDDPSHLRFYNKNRPDSSGVHPACAARREREKRRAKRKQSPW